MNRLHRALVSTAAAGLLLSGTGPALAGPAASTGAAANAATGTTGATAATGSPTGLAGLLNATNGSTTPVTGIATFDTVPSAAETSALKALGLTVQPMRRLPLALVRGPAQAMRAAVVNGVANDVYRDEPIQLLDQESADAMGAAKPRADGFTGDGVTVAVVDSGCDGTHADLDDSVVHNVKLISGEYANITPDSSNTIVVPVDQGPYSNSDIGSGHGTHVAGIIAAEGDSDPTHIGVAPDASLVCLAIGEVLFTTAVVTAYDYLLDQPELLGVDVVNNSWGNFYAQFDPRNPVAVATRAIVDQGVVVVFAAGNAGDGNGEATLNPFSQAPWVISVAAGTIDHTRADFSSDGLRYDNSEPTSLGAGGRSTYLGDRIGVVHPDVTAPGVSISSSCGPTGVAIGPCPPDSNDRASGTSMASPHVAGAAAVLLQANPRLAPDQVRMAMQVTATEVQAVDNSGAPTGETAAFWQAGYGYVDLAAAVELVRNPGQLKRLPTLQRQADRAVLAATGFEVLRSDWLTYDAPRITVGTDQRSIQVPVGENATHLKVTIAFPSEAVLGSDLNLTDYTVTVRDTDGRVIATSNDAGIGSESALVDLAEAGTGPGTYTIDVVGEFAISDPDTLDSDSLLNDTVTLQVASLRILA